MMLMTTIQNLLHRAFPWMALSGLLLAGWGLITTPDEIKADAQWASFWGSKPSLSLSFETAEWIP